MRRRMFIGVAALLLAPVSGCEGFDTQPWRLERMRVLALRASAADEPARSTPRPGEEVQLDALVAGVDSPTLRWRLEVCLAAAGTSDETPCRAALFAAAEGEGPIDFRFTAPDRPAQLRIDGVIESGEDREQVLGFVAVSAGETNRHPVLTPRFEVDGAEWPDAGCEDPDALRVGPDRMERELVVDLGAGAREAVADVYEELLVSHLTTAGALERYYSIVEPDERSVSVTVGFEPPEDSVPRPTDARIQLVVRDDRGGVAWLDRTLCLVP